VASPGAAAYGNLYVSDVPDLTVDRRASRFIKRAIAVNVVFATENDSCHTLEGSVGVKAGDAVLTGVQGEKWPVQRHLFLQNYKPIVPTEVGQDGLYHKLPVVVLAMQLDCDLAVTVGWQADELQGHSGDWLILYPDGSHGIVQDAIFRSTYESADTEHI